MIGRKLLRLHTILLAADLGSNPIGGRIVVRQANWCECIEPVFGHLDDADMVAVNRVLALFTGIA